MHAHERAALCVGRAGYAGVVWQILVDNGSSSRCWGCQLAVTRQHRENISQGGGFERNTKKRHVRKTVYVFPMLVDQGCNCIWGANFDAHSKTSVISSLQLPSDRTRGRFNVARVGCESQREFLKSRK